MSEEENQSENQSLKLEELIEEYMRKNVEESKLLDKLEVPDTPLNEKDSVINEIGRIVSAPDSDCVMLLTMSKDGNAYVLMESFEEQDDVLGRLVAYITKEETINQFVSNHVEMDYKDKPERAKKFYSGLEKGAEEKEEAPLVSPLSAFMGMKRVPQGR